MTASNRDNPPTNWLAGLITLDAGRGIYALNQPDANPLWWHWFEPAGRWEGMHTRNHTLVEREPLHLEASLLCPVCLLHGFVRQGMWQPA